MSFIPRAHIGGMPKVEVLSGKVDANSAAAPSIDSVRAVRKNALVCAGRVETVDNAVIIRREKHIRVDLILDVFRTVGQTGKILAQAGNEFKIKFLVAEFVVTQGEIFNFIAFSIDPISIFINDVPIRFHGIEFFVFCVKTERIVELFAVMFVSHVEVCHRAAFVGNAEQVALVRNSVQFVANPCHTGNFTAVSVDVAVKDKYVIIVGSDRCQLTGKHNEPAGNSRFDCVRVFPKSKLIVFYGIIDKARNPIS